MTHTIAPQQTVESTNPAASAAQPRGSFSRIVSLESFACPGPVADQDGLRMAVPESLLDDQSLQKLYQRSMDRYASAELTKENAGTGLGVSRTGSISLRFRWRTTGQFTRCRAINVCEKQMSRRTIARSSSKEFTLDENEIHIWRIDLAGQESEIHFCRRLLATDEVQRAERFYFEEHRRRFIVARGTVRQILGPIHAPCSRAYCF